MCCSPLFRRGACLGLLVLVLVSGCTRQSPYAAPIEAATPTAYNLWRGKLAGVLTGDEWRWYDVAIQEFKYQLMLGTRTSGSEAIDEAVRTRIDGRPYADVVREGLQAYERRKAAERAELTATIAINAKLKIKPDDTDMLRDFKAHQERLQGNLAKVEEDLAAVRAELARLVGLGAKD